MTFQILPEAREELFHTALEYESKESGLGVRFRWKFQTSLIESCLTHTSGGNGVVAIVE
jgi:hypothetical protein